MKIIVGGINEKDNKVYPLDTIKILEYINL